MSDERLRQLYQQGIAAREARGGVACAVAPEDLLALVRGELPEERRLELFDRVMSSERCRSEFELLRSVERAGHDLAAAEDEEDAGGTADFTVPPLTVSAPAAVPPDGVIPFDPAERARVRSASRRAPWWRRAALPMALAATAVLAVGLGRYTRSDDAAVDVMRGASDGVVAVAPAEEVAPGASPVFAWRPVPGATRYVFELLAADGTLLHEAAAADTTIALPDGMSLSAGADYRWIVRAIDAAGAQRGSTVRRLRVRSE